MSSILVSVVVINHNYRPYLKQALDSALAQTHTTTEVIVVDDGSTDGSVQMIAGFGPRIHTVLQPHQGHVAAVNAGFAASHGDIIIFLDADDLLYPKAVARVLSAWRPEISKLQYQLATIDRDGRDQHLDFPYFADDLTPAAIRAQALQTGVHPWTVSSGNAFARDYLQQLMPIDTNRIFKSPDGYLNKMAPLFGDVVTLREVLGAYRVHGQNQWAQGGGNGSTSRVAGLRASAISRAVRFDAMIQDEFCNRAARVGLQVPDYKHCTYPPTLEYRLLSLRFAPQDHPLPGDRPSKVLAVALLGLPSAPNLSWVGRVLWGVWFVALALLPARPLRYVVAATRGQLKRPKWSRLLVRLSRGEAMVGRVT